MSLDQEVSSELAKLSEGLFAVKWSDQQSVIEFLGPASKLLERACALVSDDRTRNLTLIREHALSLQELIRLAGDGKTKPTGDEWPALLLQLCGSLKVAPPEKVVRLHDQLKVVSDFKAALTPANQSDSCGQNLSAQILLEILKEIQLISRRSWK